MPLEPVDLFTESASLAGLLQDASFPGSRLERHHEEESTVYLLRNVSWSSLRQWLDENYWRFDSEVSYEVRGVNSDFPFRTYDRGEVYDGEDPLDHLFRALREEVNRADRIELNLPFI